MNAESVKSLRTFAFSNGEPAFAHLCTAALARKHWAIERMVTVIDSATRLDVMPARILFGSRTERDTLLQIICATDTSRPDGATGRGAVEV